MNSFTPSIAAEWLEADGLGGFASGTSTGIRTRRYHALLLTATTPPTGRMVLVNGFDGWIETPAGRFELTPNRFPDHGEQPEYNSVEASLWNAWAVEERLR